MPKTPAELLDERNKRINDAIALKTPDRVPIAMLQQVFPARYTGMVLEEAFTDPDKWLAANEKTIVDFEPDMFFSLGAGVIIPGRVLEALGSKQFLWPGHGVGSNTPHQYVEGEYMKAEEYDAFLDDPSDFLIRTYIPRSNSALEGLSMLPPLKSLAFGAAGLTPLLLAPPVAAAMAALNKAAPEAARWHAAYDGFYKKMEEIGFPALNVAVSIAPFDLISDLLRGMRGSMLDMYRCPEKLLAAQEKLLPFIIEMTIGKAHMSKNPRVVIPLHRGADGFMSIKQFEKFYWPGLKKLIFALVDAGLTPIPFFEGSYDQRLEYLREFPKGKVLCWFDRTDLFKAKEVIGDVLCIAGNLPISILQIGTKDQIKEYTKKLIDVVGKDGGYIMGSNAPLDTANPELVKVWMDHTKEYGVY